MDKQKREKNGERQENAFLRKDPGFSRRREEGGRFGMSCEPDLSSPPAVKPTCRLLLSRIQPCETGTSGTLNQLTSTLIQFAMVDKLASASCKNSWIKSAIILEIKTFLIFKLDIYLNSFLIIWEYINYLYTKSRDAWQFVQRERRTEGKKLQSRTRGKKA